MPLAKHTRPKFQFPNISDVLTDNNDFANTARVRNGQSSSIIIDTHPQSTGILSLVILPWKKSSDDSIWQPKKNMTLSR